MSSNMRYRSFDLILLSLLAAICQITGDMLHMRLTGAGFYITFSLLVGIIAIIRWGVPGSMVYVVAGIASMFFCEGSLVECLLLFPFSNAFIVVGALAFKSIDRRILKENPFLLLMLCVTAFGGVAVGKGVSMYYLTGNFIEGMTLYALVHLFSLIITYLVLLIIKNRAGLLVDMTCQIPRVDCN